MRLGAHPAPRPAATRTELGNSSNSAESTPAPSRAAAAPAHPGPLWPGAPPAPGRPQRTHRQPLAQWGARARARARTHEACPPGTRTHRCMASAHTAKGTLHTRLYTAGYTSSGVHIYTCKTHALTRMLVAGAQVHTHSHVHTQGGSCACAHMHTDSGLYLTTEGFLLAHQACTLIYTHITSPL